jgi:hypothetical protein
MTRFSSLAMGIALTAVWTGFAHAQSQAEIADKANEDGKELMRTDKFAEAEKKFQEALARVPEAKYFLNLCFARFQQGKFDEALTACNSVDLNHPNDTTKAKADKLIAKITEAAKNQNLELHEVGGGGQGPRRPNDPARPVDPDPPPRPANYTPTVGRPPSQNLAVAVMPDNKYTWTLGADLYGGGGRIGQPDYYASGSGGLRIKSDYMVNPVSRLGVQGYLQITHLEPGTSDSIFADTLDLFDAGFAGYKHVCLGSTPRLCVTPLLGVHLTLMSPAGEMNGFGEQVFNYAAIGARGELAFTYAFGTRFEHALSVMVGANAYSAVLAGPSRNDGSGSLTAREIGLDQGGALAYLGLGYTYRFNTPLGSTPFITLE